MNEYEPNPMLQNLVKKPKKPNKLLIGLVCVIGLLLLVIVILLFRKPDVVVTETERKQSLDEIGEEIKFFIKDNKLDALDVYGYDNLVRVAINDICSGVYNCTEIKGEAVQEYVEEVFDKKVTYQLREQGFNNILDLSNDGGKPYFMQDTIHLGWHGWLTVDKSVKPFLDGKDKVNKNNNYKINNYFYSNQWQKAEGQELNNIIK